MAHFSKIGIRDAKLTKDVASGLEVFHVSDPHALIQAAGYLKHVLGNEERKGVYFRGQRELYNSLSPTLFRKCPTARAQEKRVHAIRATVQQAQSNSPMLQKMASEVVEPLLQHYGLKTTWVDLVDNVWVALWFACYRARSSGRLDQYLHFERRLPRTEDSSRKYAYVLLVATDFLGAENANVPGMWRGATTELVDLRVATPSIFLRPHSQHGLLFRSVSKGRKALDYMNAVAGIIRVGIEDALDWLGDGGLLNAHAIFPSPLYDEGYKLLLTDWPKLKLTNDRVVGTIAHIGA